MKRLVQIITLLCPLSTFGQYIWIESAETCDMKKIAVVREAHVKFKPILTDITKEGGLIINWVVTDEMVMDNSITFTWQYATTSILTFRGAMAQFKKKASAAYPQ